MDCDVILTPDEYALCSMEFVSANIVDSILPVLALWVLLAVTFAGVQFARKVVRAFVDDKVV